MNWEKRMIYFSIQIIIFLFVQNQEYNKNFTKASNKNKNNRKIIRWKNLSN